MPASYDFSAAAYRVTCTQCDASALTDQPERNDAINLNGGRVSDMFAWHSGHQRFYTMCRECSRSRARARRASGTRRSANTTMGRTLGLSRKFGVELEMMFPHSVTRDQLHAAFRSAGLMVGRSTSEWTIKGDGSLSGSGQGIEITSPALIGEGGLRELEAVCTIVRDLGASVNRTCGTHVHHDAADLTVDQIKRVARGWKQNSRVIDGFVSESRREGTCSMYCQPLSDSDLRYIERADTLDGMRRLGIDRYRTLNLMSYGRYGTLEIRQHQGTINFEKIRTWVMLGQAIIDSAIVGEIPATSTARTFLTSLGERLDETARTFLIGRAVEFGAVTV